MADRVIGSEIDATQAVLLDEMEELRQRLLPRFLQVLAAAFVCWLMWSCWVSDLVNLKDVAWVLLGATGYTAARLAGHHYRWAVWTLLLGRTCLYRSPSTARACWSNPAPRGCTRTEGMAPIRRWYAEAASRAAAGLPICSTNQ